MSEPEVVARRFAPVPASCREVRHLIAERALSWDSEAQAEDAALVGAELASNAIFHTRADFSIVLRRLPAGVRIEVLDGRPGELPALVPNTGTASDLTMLAATGRGLMLVSSMSSRWGITTSADHKSVWAEVTADQPTTVEPVLQLGWRPTAPPDVVPVTFLDAPVRAAVASGVQVDELVRELQLAALSGSGPSPAASARLFSLLDETAALRLVGRHLALQASADGAVRFDLEVAAAPAEFACLGELNAMLNAATAAWRTSGVPGFVADFRAWLEQECAAQLEGRAPVPCTLAD